MGRGLQISTIMSMQSLFYMLPVALHNANGWLMEILNSMLFNRIAMDHWIATIIDLFRCLLEFTDASMAQIVHIYIVQMSIWRILRSFNHTHRCCTVSIFNWPLCCWLGLWHHLRISVAKENQRNRRCMHFGTSMSWRLLASLSIEQFLCDCIHFGVWYACRVSFGLFGLWCLMIRLNGRKLTTHSITSLIDDHR